MCLQYGGGAKTGPGLEEEGDHFKIQMFQRDTSERTDGVSLVAVTEIWGVVTQVLRVSLVL